MLSIVKCFSVLVASGHGERCKNLKGILHQELNCLDETNQNKVIFYKFHKASNPSLHQQICISLANEAASLYKDIDLPKYLTTRLEKR